MFERYTEEARRVIFFARYEASVLASGEITTIHLLLGLLREGGALLKSCLREGSSIEHLRRDLTAAQPEPAPGVATSVDLPLSMNSKRVPAYGAEEADWLQHRSIGIEHLLLGLLRDTTASAFLAAYGVTRDAVLEHAASAMPMATNRDVRSRLLAMLESVPLELLNDAEQMLRTLVASKSKTHQRRMSFEGGEETAGRTLTFSGNEVFITDTVASGLEPGTMDYSVSVEAFGERRSSQTTFKMP
jgi:ATP-dependent Clp protease ATP-binding subunit ClpC